MVECKHKFVYMGSVIGKTNKEEVHVPIIQCEKCGKDITPKIRRAIHFFG